MDRVAELFAAVADPTRLAVLALLQRHGECCVCEIHEILHLSQSRASRALKALRVAGLLADRRVGTWVHYRLAPEPEQAQKRLLAAVAGMIPPEEAAALDRQVTAHRHARAGGCAPAGPSRATASLPEGARP